MLTRYTKAIVAVLGAIIVVAQAAASDGTIEANEWWKILIAGVTAVGVYLFPNTPEPAAARRKSVYGEDGDGHPL